MTIQIDLQVWDIKKDGKEVVEVQQKQKGGGEKETEGEEEEKENDATGVTTRSDR